jgi:starch synthase
VAKILMVSAEAAPFAYTGSLGEVLRELPKALADAGERTAVVLPLYRSANRGDLRPVYEHLRVTVGFHSYSARIFEHSAEGVRYLLVQIPELFDRDGLYGDEDGDFSDNHIRFMALCQAALGVARHVFTPQIIHCHDWHTGLLPVLVREVYVGHPAYIGLKIVFTIHNLAFQGIFPPNILDDLKLPESLFRPDLLEFWGHVNFMKGALVTSDVLTTVSPRYSQQIQTPEFGFGLDGVLRSRSNDLYGILNGVDYRGWDPGSDPHLFCRFDSRNLKGKLECKRALLKEMGLPPERVSRPLVGIVSRFSSQEGLDLLMKIPHEIVAENISLVALGSGEKPVEDFFHWFAAAYPAKVAAKIGFDEGLEHRIVAGSDILLVPGRVSSCSQRQIYAMHYGALPVVCDGSDPAHTVDQQTGFRFQREDPYELLDCLRGALRLYGTKQWEEMVKTALERDFSWRRTAKQYVQVYRAAMEVHRHRASA